MGTILHPSRKGVKPWKWKMDKGTTNKIKNRDDKKAIADEPCYLCGIGKCYPEHCIAYKVYKEARR